MDYNEVDTIPADFFDGLTSIRILALNDNLFNVTTSLHYLKGQLEGCQSPKQKRQNGISLARTLLVVSLVSPTMALEGTAQTAAKELLDSILDIVVWIFENHDTHLLFL